MVTVPPDPSDWVAHSEDEMVLRRCGYWRHLYDLDDTGNDGEVTVRLPRSQCFSPDALRGILRRINDTNRP